MKFINCIISIFIFIIFLSLNSCGIYKKVDQREMPDGAKAKARKNIEEGRGTSLGTVLGKRGGSFEFSSSNPMWRATLETLDFLPMSTVDYSGGIIITDWYEDDQNPGKSIKITIRFLSNEISANSLKIVVHEKSCTSSNNCSTIIVTNSTIKNELNTVILREAALLKKNQNKKK
jgi:hypothetical protein